MDPHQLITLIRYSQQIYPKHAVDLILGDIETYIPYLLEELKRAYLLVDQNRLDHTDVGYLVALYILGYVKEQSLMPIYLDILRLSEKKLDTILGDILTEDCFLYHSYAGEPDPFFDLIRDQKVYVYSKIAALNALTGFVIDGRLPRKFLLEFFCQLLENPNRLSATVLSNIFYTISELKFEKLYTLSRNLLASGIIKDPLWVNEMNLQVFDDYVTKIIEQETLLPHNHDLSNIHDNISYFYKKAQTKSEKYPVNTPCYCGSGKKYKKCCQFI
jgi:uncharacterized protein YchJ